MQTGCRLAVLTPALSCRPLPLSVPGSRLQLVLFCVASVQSQTVLYAAALAQLLPPARKNAHVQVSGRAAAVADTRRNAPDVCAATYAHVLRALT